jgi:hypothetical protein
MQYQNAPLPAIPQAKNGRPPVNEVREAIPLGDVFGNKRRAGKKTHKIGGQATRPPDRQSLRQGTDTKQVAFFQRKRPQSSRPEMLIDIVTSILFPNLRMTRRNHILIERSILKTPSTLLSRRQ